MALSVNYRPYRDARDLHAIASLLRRAAGCDSLWNAWGVVRFDIWAQRRLADEQVLHKIGWQAGISLWEIAAGALAGAVAFDRPNSAAIFYHPEHPTLAGELLDWAVAHQRAAGQPNEPLCVEALEHNTSLIDLLAQSGYAKSNDWMNVRFKPLTGTAIEPVCLPDGFSIVAAAGPDLIAKYILAVQAVFNHLDTPEVYAIVLQAPSHVPALDLLALSPNGEPAAFAKAWLDRANNEAEFEPVGTVPAFQKLGLGRALMAEGCNRLRQMGCARAKVDSWSESPAANALYEHAGFVTHTRLHEYTRKIDARTN